MNRKYLTFFVGGFLLLWAVAYASISADYPKIFSPYSLIVIWPVLALHELFRYDHLTALLLWTLISPALFLLWSFPLLRGQVRIPKRSKIVASLLIALSLFSLVGSWSYGIEYQGALHTIAIYVWNLIFWSALFLLNRSNKNHESYTSNYLFHWVLFAWAAWVAFPWLGELL